MVASKSLKEYAEEVEREGGVGGVTDGIYRDVWMEAFERWQKDQHTLDNLNTLAAKNNAVIYNVCFRNAGCGIQWYEGSMDLSIDWRKKLVVYAYYANFQAAIDGEFERLTKPVTNT